jgi:hypothetical protein
MPSHLTTEGLMEVVDGAAPEGDRAHVASCGRCAALVDEARAGLALATDIEVPEPSPLYWEAFRRQIRRRIAIQQRRTWAVRLLPLLAAAAVVLLVFPSLRVTPPTPPPPARALPAWSPLPPAEDDPGLAVLAALVRSTSDLSFGECLGVTECVSELPDDESGAFLQVLRAEMPPRGGAL